MAEHEYFKIKQSFYRIGSMIRKELDWIIHDKISLVILFVLPLALIYMVGNIELGSKSSVSVIYIIDFDKSSYSEAYVNSFRGNTTGLEVHDNINEPDLVSLEKAEDLIYTTALQAYIVIPANFSEELLENRSTSVEVFIDGINSMQMFSLKYTFVYATMEYQINYQVFNGEILYFPETRPTEGVEFLESIVPNMLPNVLFAVINMVACQSIISDEPLKRMLLSPARKAEVVVAKTIVYSFLGSILVFSCIAMLTFVFGISFRSIFNLFIVLNAIVLFAVTSGVFFSTLSTSRIQAAQLFLFAYIMQIMIVNNLRIEPLVFYMPIEIVRSVFINVAFRGTTILQETIFLRKTIIINLLALILAVAFYRLKKEDV